LIRRCILALAFSASVVLPLASQTATTPPPPPPPGAANQPPRRGFAGAGGDYKHYSQETLDSGQKYYTANCAFCHGGGAKGGESGPDLLRSVFVLHDENGESIGGFIKVGRPDKGMPKFSLPEDQVRDIAAFLHDRVRQAAERSGYQILNILVGDAKAGEAYFNGAGGCSGCHSADKDLAHIGAKYAKPVDLQQKILMPRNSRQRGSSAAAETVKITQPSGEVLQGRLIRMDDFSVVFDQDGSRKTIERDSEDVPKVETTDPMQGHIQLLSRYTDSDIHNLTAYLVTLK
jgi:cytochrome c oxidase cbb3-type subunit 3